MRPGESVTVDPVRAAGAERVVIIHRRVVADGQIAVAALSLPATRGSDTGALLGPR
jgi:hypothetical protein